MMDHGFTSFHHSLRGGDPTALRPSLAMVHQRSIASIALGAPGNLYRVKGTGEIWPTNIVMEGSLEVRLPTTWADEKQRWEESEKKVRRESQRKSEERRCRCAKR